MSDREPYTLMDGIGVALHCIRVLLMAVYNVPNRSSFFSIEQLQSRVAGS